MDIIALTPHKVLNKVLLKVKTNRADIESFTSNLMTLLDRTNDRESEVTILGL